MRVAVFEALHKPLSIRSLPDPTPGPEEVILAVRRCGICGSDLHMSEEPAYGSRSGDVFGHEFAGEVIALGPAVQGVRMGDPVSVVPLRSCGGCPSCLAGEPAWCKEMALQGGGYAQYAAVNHRQCVVLPRSFSFADGALAEPLAVALHGVALSGLAPADKVLVIGAGPIGLATAFWARRLGATRVVVQDIVEAHRERSLAVGATHFVCAPEDPVGAGSAALGGPADIVFECVGLPGLIMQAGAVARVKGTIVILGLCARPDTINPFELLSKELRLITSAFFKRQEYEAALDALDRQEAEPRALVSEIIALDAVPQTFEALKRPHRHCKVQIDPWK